ncbi:MAG: aminotransferase class III-fold pyridoxal phosphate-dependent enzyme [Deltaproteobacteria bacterium]|nr:aminotransferase class III-fold pyridoxal phosphate-dependent enzyme [Deltaproteobacteria bacterium]
MIIAVVQARASSSRLPGKVLLPLAGAPMLQRQLERILRAKTLDKVVVATSTLVADDEVQVVAETLGLPVFRGSLDDVLDRFYQAAAQHSPQHVVRLTGDCPLTDPHLIDEMVAAHLSTHSDVTSNAVERTYPDGLDIEIATFAALKAAWQQATKPSDREHVMPFLYAHPENFRVHHHRASVDRSALRWTVDERDDYAFVAAIYDALFPHNPTFGTADVLDLLSKDERLAGLNAGHNANEGLARSLARDALTHTSPRSIAKGFALQERAKHRIPGLSQLLSKRPDMFSYGVWPGYYKRASGTTIWDLDDNQFLDMSIAGIGANVLGYADPDVDEAVKAAITNGSSSSLNCEEEVELADLLCEMHPFADMVRYARSGGESMAIAVRIARAHTKRDKIAFCGYHGWHDWYLAANVGTENALGEHLIPGLDPRGVPQALAGTALPFRYNHLEELDAILAKNKGELAAIVMEPIRGEQPAPGFLEGVKDRALSAGAVLIFDEISSGFRLASAGAHTLFGVPPDIAVFSKAMGNGYPIAAVIGSARVMESAQASFISSTCWTERVGPAAALATLKKHRKLDVSKKLVELGSRMQDGWAFAASRVGLAIHVSGIPPLSHFAFDGPSPQEKKALFIQLMLDQGILASTLYYPMWAQTTADVDRYLAAARDAFGVVAGAAAEGTLMKVLRGRPSTSGFRRLA